VAEQAGWVGALLVERRAGRLEGLRVVLSAVEARPAAREEEAETGVVAVRAVEGLEAALLEGPEEVGLGEGLAEARRHPCAMEAA